MNKNKWIILISVIVAVVLAAVLLIVMLGGESGGKEQGSGDTTPDTSVSTDPVGTTDVASTDATQGDDKKPAKPSDSKDDEIQVEIDMGEDEEIDEDMVIDFDDLLAAAGK